MILSENEIFDMLVMWNLKPYDHVNLIKRLAKVDWEERPHFDSEGEIDGVEVMLVFNLPPSLDTIVIGLTYYN